MREIGCIICLEEGYNYCPCQIHHIDGCKTQAAHAKTLGLCYLHHMADQQKPVNRGKYISRHPWKQAFEKRYGTEQNLLIRQNKLIEEY